MRCVKLNFKIALFFSIILICLSLSVVSASDLNDTNTFKEPISIPNNQIPGSFSDLQVEINNAPSGSVLDLYRDYDGKDNFQVQLNKDLTIDGHGHTLNCQGKTDCSAFYSSSGNIILKNLKIINGNNDNTHKGGAIYIKDSAQYTLDNCIFENNWADDYGGAIYNDIDKTLTIKNCIFKNNKVKDDDGGAIYSNGRLIIENSTFDSNNADDYGGAIFCAKSVDINNCTFISNKVSGAILVQCSGGAIYSKDDVIINNSTFDNNYAGDYGGAIYANTIKINTNQNNTLSFNSFFLNNKAADDKGGAIYACNNVEAINTLFDGNTVFNDGGAVYACNNVNVKHCIFMYNRANSHAEDTCLINSYGGAIYANDAVIDNCTFDNNFAENSGGAVYAKTITLKGSYSYFTNNNACVNKGGAIYTNKFKEDVSHVSFIYNRAGERDSDDGGAIYINDENWITFSECVFINNQCTGRGGAIYMDSRYSHLTLKNNTFSGNTAKEGQTVFNSGYYDEITKNQWGGKNPSSDNDQLIEWKIFGSNIHHTDSNPQN